MVAAVVFFFKSFVHFFWIGWNDEGLEALKRLSNGCRKGRGRGTSAVDTDTIGNVKEGR